MHQYSYNKLRVAYNDAFRQLLQEPWWCSASKLIISCECAETGLLLKCGVHCTLVTTHLSMLCWHQIFVLSPVF